jgi:SAM-dependent methyltransferase
MCGALGHPIALRESLWALMLINLATCLPLLPAGTGTFEAAGAFALTQFGLPAPEAVAAAAVYHAVQIAAATLVAALLRIPSLVRLVSWPLRELRDFQVQTSDKLRAVAFYHRASRHYRASVERGPLRLLRRREQRAVLQLARFGAATASTVIDVGCGDGFYASAAKRAGKWVHAVDLAPGMVAQVRGRVDRAEVADVEHLSTGRQYDIVLCAGVLDFVASPERAFANLCRLVAPGGRLVLLVPRAGPGGLLYRLEKGRLRVRVNLYRRAWLSRLGAEAGLTLTRWTHPLPFNMVLLFEAPAAGAAAVAPTGSELAEELPAPQTAIEALTYRQGWKSS